MTMGYRLKQGGRINRNKVLTFYYNNKAYLGYEGDTVASALLANGVKIIGRSFKFRRWRGIMTAGAEECNAIIQIGDKDKSTPNLKATQVPVFHNLKIYSLDYQQRGFDFLKYFTQFHRFMPAGFYYKTFMRPKFLWPRYENILRKKSGFGITPQRVDQDIYDKMYHHCDVIIIGAGPAGLAAALTYTKTDIDVIIVDEQNELGGTLLASSEIINGQDASVFLKDTLSTLGNCPNISVMSKSTAFGLYDDNFIAVVERKQENYHLTSNNIARERLHCIRATHVILATGAIERPLVFSNNDKPGVILAGSISTYIHRYAVMPGKTFIIFTSNDSAYQTALDIVNAGGSVAAIIDSRHDAKSELIDRTNKITVYRGHVVIDVMGKKCVRGVLVAPRDKTGTPLRHKSFRIDCDIVGLSGGYTPVIHLHSHTGTKPIWCNQVIGFLPGLTKQSIHAVGACNGTYNLAACLAQSDNVALKIAKQCNNASKLTQGRYHTNESPSAKPEALFWVPNFKNAKKSPKQFVDFQMDVTAADITLAAREGYESIEHVKRYTALGVGTDQGKLGNINGMALLAQCLNKTIPEIGTTVFRPAYTPTSFGAIAGRHVDKLYAPERKTAIHRWHEAHNAKWENVGDWKRPWYFPIGGETMDEAVARESFAVRHHVGILDSSTLGKIDIQGKDARTFINRIYSNAYLKLAKGKCRYGLMLTDAGYVFDDGVTACLNDNHFMMFTTTGGAAKVLAMMECFHQTEWPALEVYLTSVTDHYVTATISGPRSRELLSKICMDIDLSKEAFEFMAFREGHVAGIKARVFRISFSGELTYEINVNANYGRYIWERLYDAGQEYGITPYGTETMHVLRAEKGFIIVGQDTDGSVTPLDLNMKWAVGEKIGVDYIGKRGLLSPDLIHDKRKQFVGLKTADPNIVIPEGAQIITDQNLKKPANSQGHVTSSYFSTTLGHSIALALVKSGLTRLNETVYCYATEHDLIEAVITEPVFYDKKGERQHV